MEGWKNLRNTGGLPVGELLYKKEGGRKGGRDTLLLSNELYNRFCSIIMITSSGSCLPNVLYR